MSNYPNTFYRVSVKALIKNEKDEVLVLKENQDTWSLPGGRLDHGEEPIVGLRRELQEELSLSVTGVEPYYVKTFYLEPKQAWLMWIVYTVEATSPKFILGQGVTEAQFIDTANLKYSTDIFEKLVFEISTCDKPA
jgi:ADP-ribose pyrophosphatase YjhB (NUDIX family)